MAAAKKAVSKIGDKLVSVNDSFTVYMYDNGFMFEIGGKDENEEWPTAKIICSTPEQLIELMKEAVVLPRS